MPRGFVIIIEGEGPNMKKYNTLLSEYITI